MTLRLLDPRQIFALFAAFCLSLVTGFALATMPLFAVGGIVGAFLLAIIVRQPELGAVTILILVAIVPRDMLFEQGLPLGGGNLKVTDVLLAVTLGSWLAARTINAKRYPLPSRSTTLLLLGFLFLAVVSLITADELGASRKLSLLELRPLLSYLLVFPLVSGARNWKRLHIGILLVLGAGTISAGVSIVNYARGIGSDATFTGGALRVDSAVYLFPLFVAVSAPVLLAYAPTLRLRMAALGLAVVAMTGVFFTFARGAWIALFIAVPVVLVLLRPWRRRRVVGWLLALVAAAAVSVTIFNAVSRHQVADPLAAGLARLTSVGQYQTDVSSRYRVAEWETAIAEIKRHPLTGIGLGSTIVFTNPMFSPIDNAYGFTFSTFYIHNSYLWFVLKIGLVGAFVFFALIARVGWLALAQYRRARDPRAQMVLLASLGSLVTVLVLSITGPHLNVDSATPAVAALIAGVEIVRRLGDRHTDDAAA